jgi:heme exporter protein D
MTHFFAMGGYAAYVWPAYGVSALGLIAAIVVTLRGYARAKKLLASAQSRETRP